MNTITLGLGTPQLREVLLRGFVVHQGSERRAVPIRVDEAARAVELRLLSPSELPNPSTFGTWWKSIRAISLTATATPALAVLLLVWQRGEHVRLACLPAVLGAVCLQIAVNLLNDVEDHLRLVDLPGGLGGAGVIQSGQLTAKQVRRAALAFLTFGIVLGLPALIADPAPILLAGAAGALGALGYSGKPFGLKYARLGDLAVLALCGPGLTIGVSYAARGTMDLGVVLLGLYFGLAAVGILHVNNLQDAALDKARGVRTVAQLLGKVGSRGYLVLLYVVALACPWLLVLRHQLPIAAATASLLGVPLVWALLAPVVRGDDLSAPRFTLLRVKAAQTHLALGMLMVLGLLAGFWLK